MPWRSTRTSGSRKVAKNRNACAHVEPRPVAVYSHVVEIADARPHADADLVRSTASET